MKKFFSSQWLSSHKLLVFSVILGIYMVGVLIIPCFFYFKGSSHNLEFSYYISQILAALFVVSGAFIALMQYSEECNSKKEAIKKQKRTEAAKLALSYATEVIPLTNKIGKYYSLSPKYIDSIVNYLFSVDLQDFDRDELSTLYPEYEKIRINLAKNYYIESHNSTPNNKQLKEAYDELYGLTLELGNLLEYHSICFNADIVDNDTLYQSLHYAFFQAVHMIYIFVFSTNINEYDRIFSNVSDLYKSWQSLYNQKQREEKNKELAAKALLKESKREVLVKPQK